MLGIQSFEFFRTAKRESCRIPVRDRAEAGRRAAASSASCPLIWGTFMIAVGLVGDRPADRAPERDLSERIRPARPCGRCSSRPWSCWPGIPTIVYGYLALLLVTPLLKRLLRAARLPGRDVQRAARLHRGGRDDHPAGLVAQRGRALGGPSRAARGGVTAWARPSSRCRPGSCCRPACRGSSPRSSWRISRAVGETMAVVLAAGMRPQITLNPLTSIETMTTYIVQVIGGDASYGEPKYLSLFAVGLTLFAVTLTLNIISGFVLRHFREVYQ